MASESWARRFLNATPRMPDGVFVGWIVLMVFLVGVCAGILWCGWSHVGQIERLSFQQQLDALDKRLKALESR